MTVFALLLMFGQADPRVIDRFQDPEAVAREMVVERVERPAGVADAVFAQQLVDAEGLTEWNDAPIASEAGPTRMGMRSVHSASGPTVMVYFVSGRADVPGQVCRMKLQRGGISDVRYRAYRWCAAGFGIDTPEKPAPPISGS